MNRSILNLKVRQKMMKLSFKIMGCLSLAALSVATSVYAAEAKMSANTLLYISPNDYKYSVRILHPYYSYWFTQGPFIEPIAFQALQAKDAELKLCSGNETANTIIRVKPYLFYNPQLRVYHSKLEATVYSGGGSVLGNYVGEAQQLGFTSFDNGTEYHIKKVYAAAMQDLMTKLQINVAPDSAGNEARLPCGMIGSQQSEPKFSFY